MIAPRSVVMLAAVIAAFGLLPGTGPGPRLAPAQASFDCPAPALPVVTPATGSPAAEPTAPAAATPAAFPEEGGDLTVFAAASLTDAFEQIATDLESAHPDLGIEFNFAGSQALVTQLGEGAAADVFASANATQMHAAIDQGSISGEPVTFVQNRLAIVVPSDNPAGLDGPEDLAREDLQLVLAQAEVPVGLYAREAVCNMSEATTADGEGFVAAVAANVVSEEEDVRDVLTRVQLGEADAGIVYVSDAAAAGDDVELIEIPDDVNVVASYPIAPVAGGDTALAQAFIAYVLGEDGQETLQNFGFEPRPS